MRSMRIWAATTVATWLTPIAQYDPKRYAELYEKYDKEYHFRKNTNAAKLYDKVKTGEYTGKKPPKKLMESDSYNAYRKTIQSGERVFMKFTTKPKPQLIYALKSAGGIGTETKRLERPRRKVRRGFCQKYRRSI